MTKQANYLKSINISGKLKFEIDILEDEMLQFGLRDDQQLRRAYNTNFTPKFFIFLKQKINLKEPINLAIKGAVRSGKSTAGIFIGMYVMNEYGKKFLIENVCSNQMDFLGKLPNAKDNDIFVIDESKEAVFGIGSMAKKMKIYDAMNIIAKRNISTIWITPRKFNDTNAIYGLRTLGRAFKSKPRLTKFLLYNLLETDDTTGYPYGYVLIPHYADVFTYGKEFEKEYEAKKDVWILDEQQSEGNIMYEIQKKRAVQLLHNPMFSQVEKKKQKIVIAKSLLPSEFTTREIEDIVVMAEMIKEGIMNIDDKIYKEIEKQEQGGINNKQNDTEQIKSK